MSPLTLSPIIASYPSSFPVSVTPELRGPPELARNRAPALCSGDLRRRVFVARASRPCQVMAKMATPHQAWRSSLLAGKGRAAATANCVPRQLVVSRSFVFNMFWGNPSKGRLLLVALPPIHEQLCTVMEPQPKGKFRRKQPRNRNSRHNVPSNPELFCKIYVTSTQMADFSSGIMSAFCLFS